MENIVIVSIYIDRSNEFIMLAESFGSFSGKDQAYFSYFEFSKLTKITKLELYFTEFDTMISKDFDEMTW